MTEKCNDNSYMDYQTAKPTNAPSVESACKSCCCNTDTPLNENFDKKIFYSLEKDFSCHSDSNLSSSDTVSLLNQNQCSVHKNNSFSEPNLSLLLQVWAIENKITISALGKLLVILQNYHPSLPKDARTLLSISKSFDIQELAGGSYYHFGIRHSLEQQMKINSSLSSCSELYLQINIDGLPLFKSSQTQLWPILATIEKISGNDPNPQPFAIGVYLGSHKPNNAQEFLKPFVNEMESLLADGFSFNGKNVAVKIRNIVCDAQAHVFIKQVKSSAGYSGCDKCTQSGVHTGVKMVFPETDAPLHTDSSFDNMTDEQHHKAKNPFKPLPLKMVSQFLIDYMHLVCLGVTK